MKAHFTCENHALASHNSDLKKHDFFPYVPEKGSHLKYAENLVTVKKRKIFYLPAGEIVHPQFGR